MEERAASGKFQRGGGDPVRVTHEHYQAGPVWAVARLQPVLHRAGVGASHTQNYTYWTDATSGEPACLSSRSGSATLNA